MSTKTALREYSKRSAGIIPLAKIQIVTIKILIGAISILKFKKCMFFIKMLVAFDL